MKKTVHQGERPYVCQICDETFGVWLSISHLPTSDPREKLVALSRKKETYARRSIIAVKIGGDLGVLYSINFITIRDSRYIELQIT